MSEHDVQRGSGGENGITIWILHGMKAEKQKVEGN
jgi:hypothetical protein